jgi:hypothetical protein
MADTHECSGGCAYCRKLERDLESLREQAYDAIRELGRELRLARNQLGCGHPDCPRAAEWREVKGQRGNNKTSAIREMRTAVGASKA